MSAARRGLWTIRFDAVADYAALSASALRASPRGSTGSKRAYRLFQNNPAHPGLQFKKVEGEDDIFTARIGLGYRALAVMKKGRVVWYWIGSHADYDRLV